MLTAVGSRGDRRRYFALEFRGQLLGCLMRLSDVASCASNHPRAQWRRRSLGGMSGHSRQGEKSFYFLLFGWRNTQKRGVTRQPFRNGHSHARHIPGEGRVKPRAGGSGTGICAFPGLRPLAVRAEQVGLELGVQQSSALIVGHNPLMEENGGCDPTGEHARHP